MLTNKCCLLNSHPVNELSCIDVLLNLQFWNIPSKKRQDLISQAAKSTLINVQLINVQPIKSALSKQLF